MKSSSSSSSSSSPSALSPRKEHQKEQNDYPYVCVYCGTPCKAIYRQLSTSLSSIKALQCTNCDQIIDPYIEREWLLVVIDCILMRQEAYRHVLYNNNNNNNNHNHNMNVTLPRAVQLIIASSILYTYLKWETIVTTTNVDDDDSSLTTPTPTITFIATLLLTSVLDFVVQWTTIYIYLTKIKKVSNTASASSSSSNIGMKLYWSLILPTTFNVICIFVLIWENSKTIKILESLLVLCWQSLAVSTTVVTDNKNNNNNNKKFERYLAPLVGIISLIVWRFIVSIFIQRSGLFIISDIQQPSSPCVGFEFDIFFYTTRGHQHDHHPFPPLCIT